MKNKLREPVDKIKTPEALKRVLSKHRGARSKIVFTNGVFDLLHRGHVSYLWRARKLGSLLIVAMNVDASVKRLKGDTRPLNKLDDRMYTMAGLECVDYVTSFNEDTPLELIQLLKPNVLVKGGDYAIRDIVGAVKVLVLHFQRSGGLTSKR
ncbi:MAG: D-glycero-beta-D-manno-heptose 1-phosphate adenylyltransferase [Proteobacteria bacterium]|nr:MAG: D-glycero-beta-D-manno-heptose 1-phosphate adenylyltransferase [Pseudomonadota bacterium]